MKISKLAFNEIETALTEYINAVESAVQDGLQPETAKTYVRHAGTFVRWLKDDFDPGVRVKASREAN